MCAEKTRTVIEKAMLMAVVMRIGIIKKIDGVLKIKFTNSWYGLAWI